MSSSEDTSVAAKSFLSTLKQVETKLLALDSLRRHGPLSSYRSLTEGKRYEVIGRLNEMKYMLGALLADCSKTNFYERSSKTASTTSPSSGEA